jgi:hypothetical protein
MEEVLQFCYEDYTNDIQDMTHIMELFNALLSVNLFNRPYSKHGINPKK